MVRVTKLFRRCAVSFDTKAIEAGTSIPDFK